MHFGWTWELSDIDLGNKDLLDTHLDTSIQISQLSILFVFIMSSRRLQDISSRHLQDMSSRHLRDVFSVTIFCLSRRLQDALEGIKLLCWRRVENVFKANKCLLDSKVCQEMEILALSFCVKFPGLSSVLCFHSIKSSKSFFCN